MPEQPADQRWESYYRAVAGRPARPLLLQALAAIADAGGPPADALAIDLGCGDGTETLALLERGWRVLAIDQVSAAIDRVLEITPAPARPRLQTHIADFAAAELPPAELVYAGLSLPFCPPAQFPKIWAAISAAVRPGGYFAGHFFGPHDDWAGRTAMTFHPVSEVRRMLAGFVIEAQAEIEEDRRTALGEQKHWHIIEVVARRAG